MEVTSADMKIGQAVSFDRTQAEKRAPFPHFRRTITNSDVAEAEESAVEVTSADKKIGRAVSWSSRTGNAEIGLTRRRKQHKCAFRRAITDSGVTEAEELAVESMSADMKIGRAVLLDRP